MHSGDKWPPRVPTPPTVPPTVAPMLHSDGDPGDVPDEDISVVR